MAQSKISGGTVHKLPNDLRSMILSDDAVYKLWEDITPLARNEWICWVESAKQRDTRARRVEVGRSKMQSGMRRPCCWIGCIHRTDKEISPSVKGILKIK